MKGDPEMSHEHDEELELELAAGAAVPIGDGGELDLELAEGSNPQLDPFEEPAEPWALPGWRDRLVHDRHYLDDGRLAPPWR